EALTLVTKARDFQTFSVPSTDTLDLGGLRFGSIASSQRLPPVAPQNGEEPGIPPLRSVIADGNAQRLLLPDQYEQPLATRDPRADQVALQQHVVLGRQRDHDCRELRSLRFVDRDRVSQRNLVQFPEVVLRVVVRLAPLHNQVQSPLGGASGYT